MRVEVKTIQTGSEAGKVGFSENFFQLHPTGKCVKIGDFSEFWNKLSTVNLGGGELFKSF